MNYIAFDDYLFPEREELAHIQAATADKISAASMLYELGMVEPHGAELEDSEAPAQVAKTMEHSMEHAAV